MQIHGSKKAIKRSESEGSRKRRAKAVRKLRQLSPIQQVWIEWGQELTGL